MSQKKAPVPPGDAAISTSLPAPENVRYAATLDGFTVKFPRAPIPDIWRWAVLLAVFGVLLWANLLTGCLSVFVLMTVLPMPLVEPIVNLAMMMMIGSGLGMGIVAAAKLNDWFQAPRQAITLHGTTLSPLYGLNQGA